LFRQTKMRLTLYLNSNAVDLVYTGIYNSP
jgi:hypothetical protein